MAKGFICPYCKEEFSTQAVLDAHVGQHTVLTRYSNLIGELAMCFGGLALAVSGASLRAEKMGEIFRTIVHSAGQHHQPQRQPRAASMPLRQKLLIGASIVSFSIFLFMRRRDAAPALPAPPAPAAPPAPPGDDVNPEAK